MLCLCVPKFRSISIKYICISILITCLFFPTRERTRFFLGLKWRISTAREIKICWWQRFWCWMKHKGIGVLNPCWTLTGMDHWICGFRHDPNGFNMDHGEPGLENKTNQLVARLFTTCAPTPRARRGDESLGCTQFRALRGLRVRGVEVTGARNGQWNNPGVPGLLSFVNLYPIESYCSKADGPFTAATSWSARWPGEHAHSLSMDIGPTNTKNKPLKIHPKLIPFMVSRKLEPVLVVNMIQCPHSTHRSSKVWQGTDPGPAPGQLHLNNLSQLQLSKSVQHLPLNSRNHRVSTYTHLQIKHDTSGSGLGPVLVGQVPHTKKNT